MKISGCFSIKPIYGYFPHQNLMEFTPTFHLMYIFYKKLSTFYFTRINCEFETFTDKMYLKFKMEFSLSNPIDIIFSLKIHYLPLNLFLNLNANSKLVNLCWIKKSYSVYNWKPHNCTCVPMIHVQHCI